MLRIEKDLEITAQSVDCPPGAPSVFHHVQDHPLKKTQYTNIKLKPNKKL